MPGTVGLFPFERLRVSNHMAVDSQKKRNFPALFGTDGAVPPSRVVLFSVAKRPNRWDGRPPGIR